MRYTGTGNEDDEIVLDHVREVKATIARMLSASQTRRRGDPNGGVR